jgi:hypothetical protein
MQLDPRAVRQQIDNLKLVHPELLEDDEAWLATLESETSFEELLTTIIRRIEDTKALVIGTKDRFEELKARKDRFEQRVESLRNLAFKLMSAAELAKIELAEATLSLRAGTQQLVGDVDAETLLPEYRTVSYAPNKEAIKNSLKSGLKVPGFELSNGPPSLTIRIK